MGMCLVPYFKCETLLRLGLSAKQTQRFSFVRFPRNQLDESTYQPEIAKYPVPCKVAERGIEFDHRLAGKSRRPVILAGFSMFVAE